jgi:hypothetical protein
MSSALKHDGNILMPKRDLKLSFFGDVNSKIGPFQNTGSVFSALVLTVSCPGDTSDNCNHHLQLL